MRPGKGSYLAASSSAQCRDRSLRCSGTIMPSHAAVIYVYVPTVCRIRYSKYGIGISWISGSSFKSHVSNMVIVCFPHDTAFLVSGVREPCMGRLHDTRDSLCCGVASGNDCVHLCCCGITLLHDGRLFATGAFHTNHGVCRTKQTGTRRQGKVTKGVRLSVFFSCRLGLSVLVSRMLSPSTPAIEIAT